MYLNNREFTGTIPTTNVTNLQHLDTFKTQLTGTLPSILFSFPELKSFQFHSNFLNTMIPIEIGLLTQLQLFEGANNTFTRAIPSELGELTILQVLQLNHNKLYQNFQNEYLCNSNDNITYILINCNKDKKKNDDTTVVVFSNCHCCHCF